jgi:hypothetical protein
VVSADSRPARLHGLCDQLREWNEHTPAAAKEARDRRPPPGTSSSCSSSWSTTFYRNELTNERTNAVAGARLAQKCEETSGQRNNLGSYLIMPVQQLPKYNLFLQVRTLLLTRPPLATIITSTKKVRREERRADVGVGVDRAGCA